MLGKMGSVLTRSSQKNKFNDGEVNVHALNNEAA